MNENKTKEPFLRITKKANMPIGKAILVRAIAIIAGLVLCSLICTVIFKTNPFSVIFELFNGAFGTSRRIWILLRDLSLLLGVGLALLPAFKMKFWNLGGNGQILMGALACITCMFYGEKAQISEPLLVVMMIVSSILAGAIWAVIPAIFRAFFRTNETLFTLMMNYIAVGIVGYCLNEWVKTGSGVLNPIEYANLPQVINQHGLTILVAILLVAFMFVYMKYSKHGFEVAIVGENENTAKYVGINVKKVIIRTLALSGAICGIIGLLLAGAINHTINEASANNMGFTAIMVTWLAKFDPLVMVLTSFFITFISRGMSQVQTAFGITNNAVADIIVGIIYFCIIGCEFFINYNVYFRDGQRIRKSKDKSNAKEGDLQWFYFLRAQFVLVWYFYMVVLVK